MFDIVQVLHPFLWPFVSIVALMIIATWAIEFFSQRTGEQEERQKTIYKYVEKKFFMTSSERTFYNSLGQAVGNDYRIFAQVHLPTIVDHKVPGQNWTPAFRHINGKSVDFVLCDKDTLSTVLAIELDDKTHERPDRAERDTEVERILQQAGVPLLRVANGRDLSPEAIGNLVRQSLG